MICGRGPSLEASSLSCNLRTNRRGIWNLHSDLTQISEILRPDTVTVGGMHKSVTANSDWPPAQLYCSSQLWAWHFSHFQSTSPSLYQDWISSGYQWGSLHDSFKSLPKVKVKKYPLFSSSTSYLAWSGMIPTSLIHTDYSPSFFSSYVFRIICSVTFPGTEAKLTGRRFPKGSFLPFSEIGMTFAFFQSSRPSFSHRDLQLLWAASKWHWSALSALMGASH